MDIRLILIFLNLLCVGILAGLEIMAHYGLRGIDIGMDDRSQLQLRKKLVLNIRVLVPAFFLPTLLTALVITVLAGASAGLWLRLIGLLGLLVWIMLRVVGTVPINSATVDWDLANLPKDWKAQIAHAERFHDIGVWAVVICFACFLASAAMLLTAH
jgi:hypothetical protein